MKIEKSSNFIRVGFLSVIEQVINSSLSFAAAFTIYAVGSDNLITQIVLNTTFAYGISAVIKSKVITNLYLNRSVSDRSLHDHVVEKIRKSILRVILVSPVVPAVSYLTGKSSVELFIQLTFLTIALMSLDLLRNMLINFKIISSSLVSGVVGMFVFVSSLLIRPDSVSQYRLNSWIFSLFSSLITLCILERKLIFQYHEVSKSTSMELNIDSKRSLIESLLTFGINLVSYFLISQFLISLGAAIQRTYILYCAIPMVLTLALVPQFNLRYRNRSINSNDRLLQILFLQSILLVFPFFIHNVPLVGNFFADGFVYNGYLTTAVILSSASNIIFFVYAVWLRMNLGFRKFFYIRLCFLLYQNFFVLIVLITFGEKFFCYAEIGIVSLLIVSLSWIEKSVKNNK
jgi:hypothetical protein